MMIIFLFLLLYIICIFFIILFMQLIINFRIIKSNPFINFLVLFDLSKILEGNIITVYTNGY